MDKKGPRRKQTITPCKTSLTFLRASLAIYPHPHSFSIFRTYTGLNFGEKCLASELNGFLTGEQIREIYTASNPGYQQIVILKSIFCFTNSDFVFVYASSVRGVWGGEGKPALGEMGTERVHKNYYQHQCRQYSLTFFSIFSFTQKQMRKAKFFSNRKSLFFLFNEHSQKEQTNRRLILSLLQFTYTTVPVECDLLRSRHPPLASVK